MGVASPFRFDGRWVFPVAPGELWAVLSRTDRFREWWPWLRALDSDGLVEGSVARCVVRAPVPYSLRFQVAIETVDPEHVVAAHVSGDLEGPARLEVAAHPEGSEATLSWTLELRDPLLRVGSRAARPLMEWGHNWVVTTGVRQFRRRALGT
jgi:uncharacterized protein YndB with AHSA1/START domain